MLKTVLLFIIFWFFSGTIPGLYYLYRCPKHKLRAFLIFVGGYFSLVIHAVAGIEVVLYMEDTNGRN